MPRSALLLTTALLVTRPLAAQAGLGAVQRAVTLAATRLPSVSVALAGGTSTSLAGTLAIDPGHVTIVPVRASWNVDPAEPVGLSLAVYFDPPMRAEDRPGAAPAGGPKSRAVGAAEIGGGRRPGAAQPVSAVSAWGGRTHDFRVRIERIGRSDLSLGTLYLVAITQ